MTAPAVPRGAKPARTVVRPIASLDDILLELIDVDDNVRVDVGELDELAASIHELGVIQPIKVTAQPDGRFRVVWGQRRVLACRQLGRTKIPAIVEPPSDVDHHGARRSIEQLSENLQRKDLNPIEEAVALREVLDADPKLTQEALADKLGMSRPWVGNTLRLLKADPVVQDGVRRGAITASHAKSLIVLPPDEQRSLTARIEKGMSAHELENTLRWKLIEVTNREATAKRTEKAIPRVLALLETEVPKDVRVDLRGAYNLESAPILAAMKKAGWTAQSGYAWDRPEKGKCDCKVVRLEFNRKWTVTPACVERTHRDREVAVDNRAEQERRKAIELRVDELRKRIRAELEHVSIPLLILAHGDTWAVPGLVEKAGTVDPSELRDLVAAAMADRADASRIWNDRRAAMEVALEALIGMFEPVEPPAKPKGKKAAAE